MKISLFQKATVLLIMMASSVLVIHTYSTYTYNYNQVQNHTYSDLNLLADFYELHIEESIDDSLNTTHQISQQSQLNQLWNSYTTTSDTTTKQQIANEISSIVNANAEIFSISVQSPSNPDLTISNRPPASDPQIDSMSTYPQIVDMTKNSQNQLLIAASSPLLNQQGQVYVEYYATKITDQLTDYRGLGETGEIVLAKQTESGDATILIPLRFDSGAALNRLVLASTQKPIIRALNGETTYISDPDTTDYNGVPVIAVSRYINATEWGLVVKQNRSEIRIPLIDSIMGISYLYLLAGTVLIILLTLFQNKIIDPLQQINGQVLQLLNNKYDLSPINKGSGEIQQLEKNIHKLSTKISHQVENLEKNVSESTESKKKIIEEYHQKQQQLELAIQAAQIGTWKFEPRSKVFTFDSQMQSFLLLPEQNVSLQALINHIKQKLPADQFEKTATQLTQLHTQNVVNFHLSFQSSDKDSSPSKYILINGQRSTDNSFYGVGIDQTETKSLSTIKSEFITIASHQLRTPLTSITWNSELLLEDINNIPAKIVEPIQNIYQASQIMGGLVNKLLNISKVEAGHLVVNNQDISLAQMFYEVTKEHSPAIARKKHQLDTSVTPENLTINSDPNLLKEIIGNLLSNSIKYSHDKAKIALSAEQVSNDQISIQVIDNGFGIPEKDQKRVFERFFRSEKASNVDTTGTGLDLYLVKKVVELLNGSISFQSREGRGTIFTITLPSNTGNDTSPTDQASAVTSPKV